MTENLKTASDFENMKVEKEKELVCAINNEETVRQRILEIQRKIIGLQAEKKDLEISLSKARHVKDVTKIEVSMYNSKKWTARNSGL